MRTAALYKAHSAPPRGLAFCSLCLDLLWSKSRSKLRFSCTKTFFPSRSKIRALPCTLSKLVDHSRVPRPSLARHPTPPATFDLPLSFSLVCTTSHKNHLPVPEKKKESEREEKLPPKWRLSQPTPTSSFRLLPSPTWQQEAEAEGGHALSPLAVGVPSSSSGVVVTSSVPVFPSWRASRSPLTHCASV